MSFTVLTRNLLLAVLATLLLSACATKVKKVDSQLQGDVYTGTETVEYLAKGVPDRVFFATNESVLTTRSRDTLRKQAAWLRENKNINVTVEGHADERGTREYNLALGERRANVVSELLQVNGVPSSSITTVSYGEERPVAYSSNESSWSKNRRAVVKVL